MYIVFTVFYCVITILFLKLFESQSTINVPSFAVLVSVPLSRF